MANKTTRISFTTNENKRESLNRIAEAYGKNISAVINEAIDSYIVLHEPQTTDASEQGDFATD